MKPVDFFSIPAIAQVHRMMNIPRNYYTGFDFSKKESHTDWIDPLKQGVEFVFNAEDNKNLEHDEHGFTIEGKRVVLYIRDRMIQRRDSLPRFHLTWCKTLHDMNNKGQFKKYVLQNSTTGYFTIKWVDGKRVVEETKEKLNVCKNCLFALKWKGYDYSQEDIFSNFSIEEFFDACDNNNKSLFAQIPDETDLTAPPNVYPNDWAVISRELRENRLECNNCHRKFTVKDKRMLHVHHRNGVKSDCKRSNLVVLCAKCHQAEHPTHNILKVFQTELFNDNN